MALAGNALACRLSFHIGLPLHQRRVVLRSGLSFHHFLAAV